MYAHLQAHKSSTLNYGKLGKIVCFLISEFPHNINNKLTYPDFPGINLKLNYDQWKKSSAF